MKLMEAGTVFLIIGGVLLGPIGPVTQVVPCGPSSLPPDNPFRDLPCSHLETTTVEICDRALREIGAFLAPPSLPPGFRMEDEKDEKAVRPGDKWRLIGGEKVLCIPAPSGLVR